MWHQHTQVELLTDELRQLVGRGAKPLRLVGLPTLRALSNVDGSLNARQTGSAIRTYLASSIRSLEGCPELQGKPMDVIKLRCALRLLVAFDGVGQPAEDRRARVIYLLGLNSPPSQFRRPDSPERELLHILAEHMVFNATT